MDEIIKEKLRKEITEVRDIMFTAQSSFKIVDYLYRTRTEAEYSIVNRSQFLKYTAHTHWRMYVTEMSKLLSNRRTEHFNIHQLIDKFKAGGIYRTSSIPDTSIRIWEDNLRLNNEAEWISNLIVQRDSLYSHTDKDREHIKNSLTFISAIELLHIIKRMLSEIYITVLEVQMIMEPFNEPVDDLKRIMRSLATEAKVLLELEEMLDSDDFEKESKAFSVDKDDMAKWYEQS